MHRRLKPARSHIGSMRLGDRRGTNHAPRTLDTFRLTVPYAHTPLLACAAKLYGGKVEAWDNPMEGWRWALSTEANRLHVSVPPPMALSQWCEPWKGGGLVCRCDGETMQKPIHPPIGWHALSVPRRAGETMRGDHALLCLAPRSPWGMTVLAR